MRRREVIIFKVKLNIPGFARSNNGFRKVRRKIPRTWFSNNIISQIKLHNIKKNRKIYEQRRKNVFLNKIKQY